MQGNELLLAAAKDLKICWFHKKNKKTKKKPGNNDITTR